MATHKKRLIVAVLGLAVNEKGEFLLTLRNDPLNKEAHNKWEIAGGGMEHGENPEATAIRELQEEIGVTPTIISPQPIVRAHTWPNQTQVLLLTYLVTIGTQKPQVDRVETIDYRWYTLEEALKLDYLPMLDEIVMEADQILQDNPDLVKQLS